MNEERWKEINCGSTSISVRIETWEDRFDKEFPGMPIDGKIVLKNFIRTELEKAEKEATYKECNEFPTCEIYKQAEVRGAERLIELIDKNCELYEKPINNTECELMIRYDDIQKQLSELKKELGEK